MSSVIEPYDIGLKAQEAGKQKTIISLSKRDFLGGSG